MTPAERARFEKCLALAKRGATAGERAAGLAAAERVAASTGMTLAEAKAATGRRPPVPPTMDWPRPSSRAARRTPPKAKPKRSAKPPTLEEVLRQRAEADAERRRAAVAADRRLMKELVEQAAYEARQRERQAERDREWAANACGDDAVTSCPTPASADGPRDRRRPAGPSLISVADRSTDHDQIGSRSSTGDRHG